MPPPARPPGDPVAPVDDVTAAFMRHRRAIVAGALTVVAGATLFVAANILRAQQQPWTGLAMERRDIDGEQVITVRPLIESSPASLAGLRVDDRIERIDGIDVTDTAAIVARHRTLRPDDVLDVAYARGGTRATVSLQVSRHLAGSRQWAGVSLRMAVVLGLFFGVAFIVYRWRPHDPRAMLFMLTSAFIGTSLMTLAIPGGASLPPETVVPLPDAFRFINWPALVLVVGCSMASGPLLLHFLLLFPRPRLQPPTLRALLWWVYLLGPLAVWIAVPIVPLLTLTGRPYPLRAAVLVLLGAVALAAVVPVARRWRAAAASVWTRMTAVPSLSAALLALGWLWLACWTLAALALVNPDAFRFATVATQITAFGVLMLCIVFVFPPAAVAALWHAWTRADPAERQQIRWPLLGIATTMSLAMLLSLTSTVWSLSLTAPPSQFYNVVEVTTWIAYSCIPLSFAAAILRYGLMDIRIIIRLTFIYALTSVSLWVGAAATILLVAALVGQAVSTGRTATILLTLLVAGMVEPVRRRAQRTLDVRFYRRTPDLSAVLARHGEGLQHVTRPEDLERRLLVALHAAVPHRPSYVFRAFDTRRGFELVQTVEADEVDEAAVLDWLDAHAGTLRGPLLLETDGDAAPWRHLDVSVLLPIRHADTLHLVIGLGRKRSDEAWSERDLELLSSLAAQTSMAISGLQTRVRDASLREAFDNQQAMLPQTVPQPEGYSLAGAWHPALTVGGDYYDAWWLSEDALAVCIADVSGKGLPASLVMANLQATVKALASPDVSPAALCTRVNQTMAANLRRGRFVTFFVGVLWPAQHRFTFANAGHNPPVLVQPSGEVVELGLGDPALSLLREHTYRDAEVTLEPGTRLLLYTDGVTEGRAPEGEEFGVDRLSALVREARPDAATLRDDVLSAIAAWTQGRFDDDVTMVAIVRGGN
jgi:serine phosphatase RsbU (regulator of sigma subunit)